MRVAGNLLLSLLLLPCGGFAHEISGDTQPDAVFANDVSMLRARLEADQAFIVACEKQLSPTPVATAGNFERWKTENAPLIAILPAWIRLQGEIIAGYENKTAAQALDLMSHTDADMYNEAERLVSALPPDEQRSSCLRFSIAALGSTLVADSDLMHHFERAAGYVQSSRTAP